MKNIYRIEAKDYEENCINYGFVIADNYKEAMAQAMEYYGENETEYITLKYVTDNSIIAVPDKGLADAIEEGMNY